MEKLSLDANLLLLALEHLVLLRSQLLRQNHLLISEDIQVFFRRNKLLVPFVGSFLCADHLVTRSLELFLECVLLRH